MAMTGDGDAGAPTDEEIAAALAAVRMTLRRRGQGTDTGSRWLRAGRVEAVMPLPSPRSARWAVVERPA